MPSPPISDAGQGELRGVADLLGDIATAQSDVPTHGAAALRQVCRSVITGEGPCVAGRRHFSRTLDADDAALCARILVLAGRGGDPVSHAEVDALFDIDAAGGERCDDGRFEDLLAKAVMHHIMSACGRAVPRRDLALSEAVPLEHWASAVAPGRVVGSWLGKQLRRLRSRKAAETIMKIMSGCAEDRANGVSIASVFDIAA